MLSNIKTFAQFNAINEAEDPAMADPMADPAAAPVDPAAAAAAPAEPAAPAEIGGKNVTNATYLQVGKKFLSELNTHAQYWFRHGELAKKYEVVKTDNQAECLTIWCEDKTNKRTWKCLISPDQSAKLPATTVENVSIELNLYNESETLLRNTTQKIPTKELSENLMARLFRMVAKTVITPPKDQKDKDEFKRREKGNLTDDIF